MNGHPTLDRRTVVAELLRERGELLVVSGLGGTTWDLAAAGDTPLNFYLWGGMGLAVSTGLGLALARPARQVLVLTGDGEMLMGLGSLAVVGDQQPANLAIAVIDNQRYSETGGQLSHTAGRTDLAAVAAGVGIPYCSEVSELSALHAFVEQMHSAEGPAFAAIKVRPEPASMETPLREGALLQGRFRGALDALS